MILGKIGHNIVQIIYPLRFTAGPPFFYSHEQWEQIYCDGNISRDSHSENIHYIYPTEYKTMIDSDSISYRSWIPFKDFKEYFHPSVRKLLFNDGGLLTYRNIRTANDPQLFLSELFDPNGMAIGKAVFDWISSEVYVLSPKNGYLVVRLSILENYCVVDGDDRNREFLTFKRNDSNSIQNNITLDLWSKIVSKLSRNIYSPYNFDGEIRITKLGDNIAIGKDFLEINRASFYHYENTFFPYVKEIFPAEGISFSSYNDCEQSDDGDEPYLETHSFTHSFVMTDTSKIDDKYLFELCSLNHFDRNSGTDAFRKSFTKRHVWERWAPSTFYTAVEYGALTIQSANEVIYYDTALDRLSFADHLYQQHARHYTIFIILLLFYKDELQELSGRYSVLKDLGKEMELKEADQILADYYHVNQQYIVGKITNTLDGIEKWNFYKEVLGINQLFEQVKKNMKELNQRKLEASASTQNENVKRLTIISSFVGVIGLNLVVGKGSWDEIFNVSYFTHPILKIANLVLIGLSVLIVIYVFTKYIHELLFDLLRQLYRLSSRFLKGISAILRKKKKRNLG